MLAFTAVKLVKVRCVSMAALRDTDSWNVRASSLVEKNLMLPNLAKSISYPLYKVGSGRAFGVRRRDERFSRLRRAPRRNMHVSVEHGFDVV